ncbi:transporter substrate-binding domain-containing protein [Hyphomicrobium sp.]|jgi:polar amino acid transport system substrate-binding protein|uniref:transporter substrate-binding domain-containing protein n=1 Tax=Hyphomicrobium sp. TaxID=82 RepID=UPI003569FEC5
MKMRKVVGDVLLAIVVTLTMAIGSTAPVCAQDPSVSDPAAAAAALPRRVVIRFLTDSDFPPFDFYDEDGVLVGFNVDLARAICLELNTSCDIKVRPWEELIPALLKGDADAVIAGHKVTAIALKQVDFTDRYFHMPGRFAAQKDAAQVEMTPSGLEGKRIAAARGTPHEAFLKAFFHDSPLVIYENADLAREGLASGKADFLFDDGISLAFWLNGTLSRQCCEMRGGPFLEPKFFGDGMAIAVQKNDPGIRLLLNKGLDRVRASGRFEELVQRYFPVRIY